MIMLTGKVASEAEDKQDLLNCMGVALTRNCLVLLLKCYVDMTRKFEVNDYIRNIEEWERSQPVGTPYFKRTFSGYQQTTMFRQNSTAIHTSQKNRLHASTAGSQVTFPGNVGRDWLQRNLTCHTQFTSPCFKLRCQPKSRILKPQFLVDPSRSK